MFAPLSKGLVGKSLGQVHSHYPLRRFTSHLNPAERLSISKDPDAPTVISLTVSILTEKEASEDSAPSRGRL